MKDIRFRARIEIDGVKSYDYSKDSPNLGYFFDMNSDEEMEQYTGLNDATRWEELTESEQVAWINGGGIPQDWKGKPICEGDILAVDGMENLAVEYHDGTFQAGDSGQYLTNYSFRVIGNIYENPELMKQPSEAKK